VNVVVEHLLRGTLPLEWVNRRDQDDKCLQNFIRNPERTEHLAGLVVDGSIILK
jgi:hypothetical protein